MIKTTNTMRKAIARAKARLAPPTDTMVVQKALMDAVRFASEKEWGALGTDLGRAKWRRPGYGSLHMKLLMQQMRQRAFLYNTRTGRKELGHGNVDDSGVL